MKDIEEKKFNVIHNKLFERGFTQYKVKDVIIELNELAKEKKGQEFEIIDNSIYLPIMAKLTTYSDITNSEMPHKNYYQLVLNPQIVNDDYLSKFYNSVVGKLIRKSLLKGTVNARIFKKDLLESLIYLPDIEKQKNIDENELSIDFNSGI